MAGKKKEPVHHVQMTDGKRRIIQQLLVNSIDRGVYFQVTRLF